jgi:hypothetical protein
MAILRSSSATYCGDCCAIADICAHSAGLSLFGGSLLCLLSVLLLLLLLLLLPPLLLET